MTSWSSWTNCWATVAARFPHSRAGRWASLATRSHEIYRICRGTRTSWTQQASRSQRNGKGFPSSSLQRQRFWRQFQPHHGWQRGASMKVEQHFYASVAMPTMLESEQVLPMYQGSRRTVVRFTLCPQTDCCNICRCWHRRNFGFVFVFSDCQESRLSSRNTKIPICVNVVPSERSSHVIAVCCQSTESSVREGASGLSLKGPFEESFEPHSTVEDSHKECCFAKKLCERRPHIKKATAREEHRGCGNSSLQLSRRTL